jgi:uncharacterized membrane-anchored protein
MKAGWIFPGLVAVVVIQLGVLIGVYLNAVYPLWSGREILLKTTPVDPRSLFRGNYARLSFDISSIAWAEMADKQLPRQGEIIYVRLKKNEEGLYEYDNASRTKFKQGLFIRGRVQNPVWMRGLGQAQVRYGIEAYFAPKDKALALEKELQAGGIAKVMVASNGKAALKEVVAGGK